MNQLKTLPYRLGALFEKNSEDLELIRDYNTVRLYRSFRYPEICLFGRVFESVCYLWFRDKILYAIEYRFESKYFEFFTDSINEELPDNLFLSEDLNNPKQALEFYSEGIAVSLVELNSDYFLMRVSEYPSLPRIKKER